MQKQKGAEKLAKKKKKKNIAKRKARANQRKAKKRKVKLRLIKSKQEKQQREERKRVPPDFDYPFPPPQKEVPEGFRSVGMTEAMMEFAKAIVNSPDIKGLDNFEELFNLIMPLWNYSIACERDVEAGETKSEILKSLMQSRGINEQEAENLLAMMVALKKRLFPPEIQPHGTMRMFMRKEYEGV